MSTTVQGPPRAEVSSRWVGLFAVAWLGIWLAQLTPFQLLLPQQINHYLGIGDTLRQDNWHHSLTQFGLVSGVSAICALIAFPLAGSLSDRTTSRLGRRRPWIIGGLVVFAVALVVLGVQNTLWGITIGWAVAITGFSVCSAALTALISDQVPVEQRGVVSSWVSAPQAVGVIIGIALVSALGAGPVLGYTLAAILLLACVIPFVMWVNDPPVDNHLPSLTVRRLLGELWISPREQPDFGWTLLGRILVNIGNALGTSLLLFFLQFGLHIHDPNGPLLIVTAVYMIFVIGAALGGGVLSDRIGRRKPFVLAAGVCQGGAAIVIACVQNLPATMVAAALLGAGFGCFLAVDQALATQVLPDAAHSGKDLGIMNIAMAVPQAIGPLLGAWVIDAFGGFAALFVASAVLGIAGGAAVLPVKGVR
ncbi:MFS transporter [Jongsikchunia kroppenstedtii]|uniref:MFS transporter n=1 Tax=Jongsikchunia kroppenstedtii TaxID=1121721 RepID=UPI00036D57E9|nr:MFS transporter [Jongsikchunia kroppenstedtii]